MMEVNSPIEKNIEDLAGAFIELRTSDTGNFALVLAFEADYIVNETNDIKVVELNKTGGESPFIIYECSLINGVVDDLFSFGHEVIKFNAEIKKQNELLQEELDKLNKEIQAKQEEHKKKIEKLIQKKNTPEDDIKK